MQHDVYKAEGLPVLPTRQAVEQSGAVCSRDSGARRCLEDFWGFCKHPWGGLAMLTLEEAKGSIELKFSNWEKVKSYQ